MTYYLLHIVGDVEPEVLGRYRNAAERDRVALKLKRRDEDGIFMLDIPKKGKPIAHPYMSGFFRNTGALR